MEVSLPVGDLKELLDEIEGCRAKTHCNCHDIELVEEEPRDGSKDDHSRL